MKPTGTKLRTGADDANRDMSPPRDVERILAVGSGRSQTRVEHLADAEPAEHLGRTPDVIALRMGQDHRAERVDSHARELPRHVCLGRALVHEHACARCLEERRIPLAHVQERDTERDRWHVSRGAEAIGTTTTPASSAAREPSEHDGAGPGGGELLSPGGATIRPLRRRPRRPARRVSRSARREGRRRHGRRTRARRPPSRRARTSLLPLTGTRDRPPRPAARGRGRPARPERQRGWQPRCRAARGRS